jgi:hypothetical protein
MKHSILSDIVYRITHLTTLSYEVSVRQNTIIHSPSGKGPHQICKKLPVKVSEVAGENMYMTENKFSLVVMKFYRTHMICVLQNCKMSN